MNKRIKKVNYEPKTEFGKKLMAIRNKAIEESMKLLSADEVLEEINKRRYGEKNNDKHM